MLHNTPTSSLTAAPAHDLEGREAPNDRALANPSPALSDAVGDDEWVHPSANPLRNPLPNPVGEPPTARDRDLLLTLARLRLLTYGQVKRQFFAGKSSEAVGKRMRRLAELGWVSLWDQPVVHGGRPCWVVPSRVGLAWAFDCLRAEAAGTAQEALVARLLPRRAQPLVLPDDAVPPWLAHQKEVNHLAQGFALAAPGPIRWASSLDRPLPAEAQGVTLPQPDLVLVLDARDGGRLVFLEHDRGMESPLHFRAAKVVRYAELAARPALCAELLGFPRFEVWVSVLDKRLRRPLERLRMLAGQVAAEGAEDIFRFTLGGWASAWPAGRIWFANGAVPEHDERRPEAHEGLTLALAREGEAGDEVA